VELACVDLSASGRELPRVESSQTAVQGKLVIETNKLQQHVTDQEAQILGVASLVFERHNFDIGVRLGGRVRLGTRLFGERRGLRWILGSRDGGLS
jgi:hypothetical protein